MAFNGSGVHNRVHDWTQDLTNTIPVTASRMDAEHDDISSSLSNAICRDGQSTTTARIPFASGLSTAAGSTSSVAYAQTNDNNTGMYFPATDQWGLVAGGTATLTGTATKLTAAVAVDFAGAAAPASDDGAALGSTSQMWSDLFLASGAVINFNNGDVTVTHSANTLAFAGASTGYTFDAPVSTTGTLACTGNLAINTNKFMVVAASGNTEVAGTFSVSGPTVLVGTSQCNAAFTSVGDFTVGSNKLNVTAANGNTAVAGTLAVTGAMTANNSAGVTARNTLKAFGRVVNGALQSSSFNVDSIADGGSFHTVTFTSALASASYTVSLAMDADNGANNLLLSYGTLAAGSFRIHGASSGGTPADPDSYSFMVLSNE